MLLVVMKKHPIFFIIRIAGKSTIDEAGTGELHRLGPMAPNTYSVPTKPSVHSVRANRKWDRLAKSPTFLFPNEVHTDLDVNNLIFDDLDGLKHDHHHHHQKQKHVQPKPQPQRQQRVSQQQTQYKYCLDSSELGIVPIPFVEENQGEYDDDDDEDDVGSDRDTLGVTDARHGEFLGMDNVVSVGSDLSSDGFPDTNEWTAETHRSFVEAILDMGIKHSSPAVILEFMQTKSSAVTSERVKSRLQKFRKKNAQKGKSEFMAEYDVAMATGCEAEIQSGCLEPFHQYDSDHIRRGRELQKSKPYTKFLGGAMAAGLTNSVLAESAVDAPDDGQLNNGTYNQNDVFKLLSAPQVINFPELSPEEAQSPVGRSIISVQSIFSAMINDLERQRRSASSVSKRMSAEENGES